MTFLPLFIAGIDFDGNIKPIITVAIIIAVVFVILYRKKQKNNTPDLEIESVATEPTTEVEAVVSEEPAKEEINLPYTPGYVTLDGVKEQDAAVIMAITSKETGIPLERLCFKYIRRLNQEPELINIEEQDAAVIMALISHKTGTPLENLIFNSIKLVEE